MGWFWLGKFSKKKPFALAHSTTFIRPFLLEKQKQTKKGKGKKDVLVVKWGANTTTIY